MTVIGYIAWPILHDMKIVDMDDKHQPNQNRMNTCVQNTYDYAARESGLRISQK